jgi:ketosteroid isomerase-like protein
MKRALIIVALLASPAFGLEGKWTPQQVLQLDAAWLKKQGLELPPSRLWDPKRGTGLLAATINVSGCSGGFISPEGLFITNHHCLFSILQEHATPQNDVITNGYVAASRAAELRGSTVKVTVPRRFVDVTKEVLAAVPAGANDTERYRAIEKKENALIAECETQPSARCRVASFDGGVQYVLADALELSDIRLVYAPPRAVGEYGGEEDNWMWPRHAGDFAIGRAYANGAPFPSEHYFPIATSGLKPGDFVMVLGYPGVTYRSLTAEEMTERRDLFFTRRVEVYGEWIRILEETTKGNAAAGIAVADNLKSLSNRWKNAEGQLAGFRRGRIVEKQRAADDAVLQWAARHPAHREAVAAHEELRKIVAEEQRLWDHDFLIGNALPTSGNLAPLGPKPLFLAASVVRSAIERQKPDGERDSLYMNRNLPRLRERLEREQKNYYEPADKALLANVVRRALALPAEQRIASIDKAFGDGKDLAAAIDRLYASTKLFDAAERDKMLGETPEQLHARHDPLVELGFDLERDLRDYNDRHDRWDGAVLRLRPQWRRAVIAHAGKPVAPDANGTLRVSFARVEGYSPRDGLRATPQTTLAGVVEKNSGVEPFNAPKAELEAAAAHRYGRWRDSRLHDVPVDFLADADTTGGNSGSPVVNGRGELVGVNFDRVWENVANDFGYNPDVARNVSVDVRYLLWMLDVVQNAQGVLRELGVPARKASIDRVLDDWHQAAADADERRYFGHAAPEFVFLGTDATERWDLAAFRAFAHPYFAKGKAWTFVPRQRNVIVAPRGDVAWFDEKLDSASYGECRGSGVVRKVGGAWKIAHYNLTIPIPNALAKKVVEMIRSQ